MREQIGAFGGDPDAVTVAGQSSGAIAISALLAGGCRLFDRAILQSGGLERVRSTAAAAAVAEKVISSVGREPDVEEILAAQRRIDTGFVPPQGPFHPCIDGDVIADHPLVVARTRAMPATPILAGTTRDEWRIFDAALDEGVFTEQYVHDRARALAGDSHDPGAVVATYRAEQHALRDVASAMVTDYHFTAPTEQFIRTHAEARQPGVSLRTAVAFSACRARGLPRFVSALAVRHPGRRTRSGRCRRRGPPDVGCSSATVAGVRSWGEPWEQYDGAGGPTMLLGPETRIVRRHRAEQLAIWENRYPAYG